MVEIRERGTGGVRGLLSSRNARQILPSEYLPPVLFEYDQFLMALNELDQTEDKLFHPFANKVGPLAWLQIFFFENNPIKIWLRAMAIGAAIVWVFLKQDPKPIILVLVFNFLWDITSSIYWRKKALFHRKKLEETAEKMNQINKEIEEKQKYFEQKKQEYLRDHPELNR